MHIKNIFNSNKTQNTSSLKSQNANFVTLDILWDFLGDWCSRIFIVTHRCATIQEKELKNETISETKALSLQK